MSCTHDLPMRRPKQIGNIESFCTKNNCRSTRLAGFYEWFILSGIEVLRNGPKQMLVNELLKQGVLTSPFDKSTIGGYIYTRVSRS